MKKSYLTPQIEIADITVNSFMEAASNPNVGWSSDDDDGKEGNELDAKKRQDNDVWADGLW